MPARRGSAPVLEANRYDSGQREAAIDLIQTPNALFSPSRCIRRHSLTIPITTIARRDRPAVAIVRPCRKYARKHDTQRVLRAGGATLAEYCRQLTHDHIKNTRFENSDTSVFVLLRRPEPCGDRFCALIHGNISREYRAQRNASHRSSRPKNASPVIFAVALGQGNDKGCVV